jgi:hypothetical protein
MISQSNCCRHPLIAALISPTALVQSVAGDIMSTSTTAPTQDTAGRQTRTHTHRHRPLRAALLALSGALLLAAAGGPASAAPHGGFGGGGHAAFGGARGGFAHGGFARGGFARGGGGRGYAHPYGRGGRGYGWRGYGRGYGWGPYWGWGVGLGLGLYLSTLPWDYATYWWDGVPYYYAGNSYYIWDGADGRYESVQPPSQVSEQAVSAPPMKLYAYPKNGQSAQQQAADTAECVRWAHQQVDAAPNSAQPENGGPPPSGSTGTRPGVLSTAPPASESSAVGAIAAATGDGAATPGAGVGPGSWFTRAEAACLTGKGYSVD